MSALGDAALDRGTIDVHLSGGVASVEITNPSRQNALTRAMCMALQELMARLGGDPAVEVVTLRGSGGTFSSGAGLHELTDVVLDEQPDGSRVDHLSLADAAIASVAKPTVALVEGACMGGGWQIASACDFIIASTRSVFAVTPAKIGFLYPRRGVERLVRQVGPANAKYILLTAEGFSASRALTLGLVSEVVPEEDFEQRCESLIQALQTRSRFSMHAMKRLVDLTVGSDAALDEEWATAWNDAVEGPDMAIGVGAFLSRQQPRFTWQPSMGSPVEARPRRNNQQHDRGDHRER